MFQQLRIGFISLPTFNQSVKIEFFISMAACKKSLILPNEWISMTTTYNLDPNFVVDIPTKEDKPEVEPIDYNINCHTDGSKRDDNRTGAGAIISNSQNKIAKEAIHLGTNATVFQAAVQAVARAASHLIFAET